MNLTLFALRSFLVRPVRQMLTVGGVAIGVGLVVAAWLAVSAVRESYHDLFSTLSGRETLEIVAAGRAPFDPQFAEHLTGLPGVKSVEPRILVAAAFAEGSNGAPVIVYGTPAIPLGFELLEGQAFGTAEGAWLDERTAKAKNWGTGTYIHLWTPKADIRVPVVGLVAASGSVGRSGVSVVCLPLPFAQQHFAAPGQVNSLEVQLADGADTPVVQSWLAREIPNGLMVSSSQALGTLQPMMAAIESGLSALGLIALVTAGFVVINTFMMNLSERRSQLAILRSIGARRGQIMRIILQEAAVLGLLGSVFGTIAGLALAPMLTWAFSHMLGLSLGCPEPSPFLILCALLLGPVLSLGVTWILARNAAGRAPLDDLARPRGSQNESRTAFPWRKLSLFATAMVLSYGLTKHWLPVQWEPRLLAPTIALLQATLALLLPCVNKPLIVCFGVLMQKCFAVEGKLARCQLARRSVRTSLTAGVLFIVAGTAVGFGHWLLNSLDDVRRWYSRAIVADYLVRGCMTDSNFVLSAPLPELVGEDLEKLPGVDRIDRVAFIPAVVNGRTAMVLARTIATDRPPVMDLRQGEPQVVLKKLLAGEVVIGTGLANQLGLRIGQALVLESVAGPVELRIAGIANEYASGGEVVYLEWSKAGALLKIPGPHVFLVTSLKGDQAISPSSIQTFCAEHHLLLQANADLRELIENLPHQLEGALWVLIVLTFLLASLGLTNTLTMNVLEQSRELKTLNAIGMTSSQGRRVILGQMILLALTALLLGTVFGIGLAWLLNSMTNAIFGRHVDFAVRLPLTLGCFVAGMIMTTLASSILGRWKST